MRTLIACGLILQTSLGLTSPAKQLTTTYVASEQVSSLRSSDIKIERPTAEEVRNALETLKKSGVRVEVGEPRSNFHYTGMAAKTFAWSAGGVIVSLAFVFSEVELLASFASIVGTISIVTAPVALVATGIAGLIEGMIYLNSEAVLSAHAAELEDGILSNPESLKRYLELPVETQLEMGGPRLNRLVIELARPL